MITYKQRKDYAIVTGVLFFLGMLLYGFLSYSVKTWFLDGSANYKSISVTVAALLGGVLLGGLCSGIFLFARFIKDRPTYLKVICAVFFPLTMSLIGNTGIISLPFYYIYNIVKLVQERKTMPKVDSSNVFVFIRRMKRSRSIVNSICIVSAILLLLFGRGIHVTVMDKQTFYRLLPAPLAYTLTGLALLIIFIYAVIQNIKILSILNKKCDPHLFLQVYDNFYNKFSRSANILLPLSKGYFLAREYVQSFKISKGILSWQKTNMNTIEALSIAIQSYFFLEDKDELNLLKNEIDRLKNAPALQKPGYLKRLENTIQKYKYAEEFFNEKYDDAKTIAISMNDNENDLTSKLIRNYYIVLANSRAENKDDFSALAQEILDKGNKLMIVKLTEQIINQN